MVLASTPEPWIVALVLVTTADRRFTIGSPPPALRRHVGARVWVGTAPEAGIPRAVSVYPTEENDNRVSNKTTGDLMQHKRTFIHRLSPGRSRFGTALGTALLAVGLLSVVACEEGGLVGTDDEGPLTVESLTITAAEAELTEGATSHFQAQARTASDIAVDTATITWTSRDPSVATVGASTGTVTAVMHGETYIVAETGAGGGLLTDSVLLAVEIPALTGGTQAEIRIRGAVTESHSWNDNGNQFYASLWVEESMAGSQQSQAYLEIEFDDNGDDMGFFALFPRTASFAAGTFDLVEASPEIFTSDENLNTVLDGPVAVFMVEGANSDLVYLGTGGTLTLESVSGQPGYTSDEAEEVTGRFSMTAVGYTFDYETEEMTPTGDTVEITGLFAVEYEKEQVPFATLEVTTEAGEQGITAEYSYMSRFGDEFSISTYGTGADGREWWLRTVLVAPSIGTFQIEDMNGEYWGGDSTYVRGDYSTYDAATDSHEWTDLYSVSGTVVVNQYVDAPMPAGVIEGNVSVQLEAYAPDGTATGEQVQAEIYFISPSQERPYDEFFRTRDTVDDTRVIRRGLKGKRPAMQSREGRNR